LHAWGDGLTCRPSSFWEAQNLEDSRKYVTLRSGKRVQMSEEDLELLITTDDPGEDTLEEDTFHLKADNTTARQSGHPEQGADPTRTQK
jgi:hypothetical protein